MRVVGIDSGVNGAIVLLVNGSVEKIELMPVYEIKKNRKDYIVNKMVDIMIEMNPDRVFIEKVIFMPNQSSVAIGLSGVGFGIWKGIFGALKISYVEVAPNTWKKLLLKDVSGDNKKMKSIIVCSRLYPYVDLKRTSRCKKFDDNIAEAILIATYGLKMY